MKKLISLIVAACISLSASFAIDYATAQKACESFIMDKNAACVKYVITYGNEKGIIIFRASEIYGVNVTPDGMGVFIPESNARDMSNFLGSIKLKAVSSIGYTGGILTVNIDGSKL